MTFTYDRRVRFQDTDAAGVVYFANVLAICHEAYEASLAAADIDLKEFFSASDRAVPIVHASVDFLRPLYCGDRITIQLAPSAVSDNEFEIRYEIWSNGSQEMQNNRLASKALTRHVCINPVARSRQTLPASLHQWLQKML